MEETRTRGRRNFSGKETLLEEGIEKGQVGGAGKGGGGGKKGQGGSRTQDVVGETGNRKEVSF